MVQELLAQVEELQEALTESERQAAKHRGAAEAAQMQNKVRCCVATQLWHPLGSRADADSLRRAAAASVCSRHLDWVSNQSAVAAAFVPR